MLLRSEVLKSIKELPEKFSVDELMDRIMLLHKIETGLSQSKEGKVVSTEEAGKRLKKWLK